jgi:hypothetical protein
LESRDRNKLADHLLERLECMDYIIGDVVYSRVHRGGHIGVVKLYISEICLGFAAETQHGESNVASSPVFYVYVAVACDI